MSASDYTALRRLSQINAFYSRQPGLGFDNYCNPNPCSPCGPCGPVVQYVPVINGCHGYTGSNGAGPTGPTGPGGSGTGSGGQGPTGPKGDPGNYGSNGSNGTNGVTGPKGDPGNNGTNGVTGPKGDPGTNGSGGGGGGSTSSTQTFILQFYYKIENNISSFTIEDISHNLPSSFNLYLDKTAPNAVYISNDYITDVENSYEIMPISAIKQFATNNTSFNSQTPNIIITWNANKTWSMGPLTGLISLGPSNNLGGNCILIPANSYPSGITLTTVRTLPSAITLTTGTKSTVSSNLTVTPGTFTGNLISINASYISSGGIGGSGIITSSGTSEILSGNAYVNLASLYLTFPSSIC